MNPNANVNSELNHEILELCQHLAGPCPIVAIAFASSHTRGSPKVKINVQVLLVLREFQPRLMSYPKLVGEKNVVVFPVDQRIFERDVGRGLLGEALASFLIFPYDTLVNPTYLLHEEIRLKKRLILELLQNLSIEFPELSYRIHIKPQYFMYEVIMNRVRVFPPMAYGVSNFMSGEDNNDKVKLVLGGYMEALKELEKAGLILFNNDGYVLISEKFVVQSKKPKVRLTNLSKYAPRALFSSVFGLFPQVLNFLSQNTEVFSRLSTFPWIKDKDGTRRFIDPKKYIFAPTAQGLVSLADKADVKSFAKKILAAGGYSKIKVEDFGGVLNDVFLITAFTGSDEKKILVKRFKEWSDFKWFPLNIWAAGARTFAVLGAIRLERECAISELLSSKGFRVPKILHISHNKRLIFMEFVKGENLTYAIKRIVATESKAKIENELLIIRRVGEIYAKVHALGVVLGDTKPENVLVSPEGEIYLLDFEQASREGDKSWDIAEFLYFSGHYLPIEGEAKAEAIATAFINGYLKAGGGVNTVKKAGNAKFTRVFSIFTPPSIIRVLVNSCKKTERRN
jgi:tRNA A-37 threonylcarbamoyl transferase component Bud32